MTDLLTGVTCRRPLRELATIHTVRERYRISQPTRQDVLVELAGRFACARRWVTDFLAWREVEVELGTAERAPKWVDQESDRGRRAPIALSLQARARRAVSPRSTWSGGSSALTEYLNAQMRPHHRRRPRPAPSPRPHSRHPSGDPTAAQHSAGLQRRP